ncbi:DEAD/DEAH box helicase [Streptomyces yaizuensis]|uniref:DEAD/DEAH box helicase n=1 Tax=Streptomyces yaizuensis TaxID=2989713 RepID=A0ABQ5P6B3_9ACTN|nr:Helicase associated domain protein [Streptomyces sp. YSPA8]GLF98110.1 DEAD/DEAH box helicase [Streptomyces sp. YSPA8]
MNTTTPLWAHQEEAVEAVCCALRETVRTLVVMACGSGKTRVAFEAAGVLAPSEPVLIVVPTLDLLAQTLGAWQGASGREGLGRVVAVCSDREVMDRDTRADLTALEVTVTTDPAELAGVLSGPGRVTAAVTYQSVPVLVAAHRDHGARPWRFAVVDEAHRSAGVQGRKWSMVHDQVLVPVERRLYLTATPRITTGEGGEDGAVISMDDEKIFGRVSYRLPYARARALGLLAGYRVIVAVVTDAEVRRLALAGERDPEVFRVGRTAVSAPMLARQIAVLRAMDEFGIRRLLTYHHRVRDARWFARTLPAVAALLHPGAGVELVTDCVHGKQSGRQRRQILELLRPDGPQRVVISNARVLGEGVDTPAVEAVAFVDGRDSAIDTVQALGRAMRLDGTPDKTASVIIPVLLEPGQDAATALESCAYKTVWRVAQALRDHDDELAAYFDQRRILLGRGSGPGTADELPAWLHFSGAPVPASFAAAIGVQMVRHASAAWEEYYGAAKEWTERHGDLSGLQVSVITPSGLRLGDWIVRQRDLAARGKLPPDRYRRLDALGMVWDRHRAAEVRYLAAAREFHREHGHLRVPTAYRTPDGEPLGDYLSRVRLGETPVTCEQKADLTALGMRWKRHADEAWQRNMAAARAFRERHGHLLVPAKYVTDDDPPIRLGAWFNNLRTRRDALTAEQRRELDDLGMVWDVNAHLRQRYLDAATVYYQEHGNLLVPQSYRTPAPDHLGLGTWISEQRQQYAKGTLTAEQIAQLEAIGMVWDLKAYRWNTHLRAATVYYQEHGNLLVPQSYRTPAPDDLGLGTWISEQRRQYAKGILTEGQIARLEAIGMVWSVHRQPGGRRG